MTKTESVTRDSLRAKIFASENLKPGSRIITLFGEKVEIRQPTIAQISKMSKASVDEKVSPLIRIITEYTYVPGTDERVFEAADAEALSAMPSGKWLSDFNTAMEELSGVDVKGAEKNSEETD